MRRITLETTNPIVSDLCQSIGEGGGVEHYKLTHFQGRSQKMNEGVLLYSTAGGNADGGKSLSSLNVSHGDIIELTEIAPPAPTPAPAPALTPAAPTPSTPVPPPAATSTSTPSPPPRPTMSDEEYARQLYESDLSSMPTDPIASATDEVRQADERRTEVRFGAPTPHSSSLIVTLFALRFSLIALFITSLVIAAAHQPRPGASLNLLHSGIWGGGPLSA